MRVMCLSDAILNRNGVGTYYLDLLDHLKDNLAYTELICPKGNGKNGDYLAKIPLPGDPTQNLYFPKLPSLVRRIKSVNPHLLIIPTPGPYGLIGYGLSRFFKIPLFVGYHTQYDKLTDFYWNPLFSTISRSYMKLLNRIFFSAGNMVVANSVDMVKRAENEGAHRVKMIGTPIAKTFLEKPFWKVSGKIDSVCFCGRLTLEKNIPDIINAARQLPHLTFTIAGDGPLKSLVADTAAQLDNVNYAGWVSRKRVKEIIDGSDLLLLPSEIESFGTIALEAMARKRPALVSPNCGILKWPDLCEGIYTMEKGETLLHSLRRIAAYPDSYHEQKAENAYHSAQRFNDATIRQWTELFESCIETESIDSVFDLHCAQLPN